MPLLSPLVCGRVPWAQPDLPSKQDVNQKGQKVATDPRRPQDFLQPPGKARGKKECHTDNKYTVYFMIWQSYDILIKNSKNYEN